MDSKNSRTSDPKILLQNLSNSINLRKRDNHVALSNLSTCHTWINIKKSHKNNEFKTLGLIWNKKFELHDGSYPGSDIQDYLKYIIKKHEIVIIVQYEYV